MAYVNIGANPSSSRIGIWDGNDTMKGDANLTWKYDRILRLNVPGQTATIDLGESFGVITNESDSTLYIRPQGPLALTSLDENGTIWLGTANQSIKIYGWLSNSKLEGEGERFVKVDADGKLLAGTGISGDVNWGLSGQIPYMNAAGDNFLYSANLTFNGSALIINPNQATPGLLVHGDSNYRGTLYDDANDILNIYNYSSSASTGADIQIGETSGNVGIYYDYSAKRVGIGITNPVYQLDMVSGVSTYGSFRTFSTGTSYVPGLFLMKSANATLGTITTTTHGHYLGEIRFYGVNSSNVYKMGARILSMQRGTAGTYVPADLRFYVYDTVGHLALYIQEDGKIGINDDTPSYTLDVNGTGRFTGVVSGVTPTADDHLATKEYVDDKVGESGSHAWSCSGVHFDTTWPEKINVLSSLGIIEVNQSSVTLSANVDLPNGATITAVKVYGNGAASARTWYLKKAYLYNTTVAEMASANINTEDTTISYPTVNNYTYRYYVYTSSLSADDRIYGVKISYTL